jgi:hypothetical protein
MTKTVANLAGSRHLGVFADPRLALLAVIGLTTYTLGQNAYRTAGLAACLPAQAVLQPMVGSVLGVIVYHERIHGGVGHIAGALVATGIAAWGIATLARSPLVHHVAPLEAALPVGPPAVDSLTLPR